MLPDSATLLIAVLFALAALAQIGAAVAANAPLPRLGARPVLVVVGAAVATVALLPIVAVAFDVSLASKVEVALAVVAVAILPLSTFAAVLVAHGRRLEDTD